MRFTDSMSRLLVGATLLLLAGAASAQATRTWVSGVGDDANPCSRTAPCKTFAGAISKTAASGIINVLDPAGFGGVTITKAITIEAVGDVAGVLVSGTNGVIVNAGANDVVVLRGLSFQGLGTGLNAINFLAGNTLIVDNCVFEGFNNDGISFKPSSGLASLAVRNSLFRSIGRDPSTSFAGIDVAPGASASASIAVDGVQIVGNGNGVRITGVTTGVVRNTVISDSLFKGVFALSPGAADVTLDNLTVTGSGEFGVLAQGSTTILRLNGSTVTGNSSGILGRISGRVLSYGNNRITGNQFDGTPNGSLGTQ